MKLIINEDEIKVGNKYCLFNRQTNELELIVKPTLQLNSILFDCNYVWISKESKCNLKEFFKITLSFDDDRWIWKEITPDDTEEYSNSMIFDLFPNTSKNTYRKNT